MESVQRVADAWRAYAMRMRKKLTLYILRLPAGFNHLDSVLGVINQDECVIYPPVFEPYGPASVDVVRVELSGDPVRPTRSDDFFESLRQDGVDFHPIPCGGIDPVDQQREQWFSGVNMLAVAPGKVIVYRSAERTIEELARRGYNVVDANDVHSGAVKLSLGGHDKWALKIKGSELSRGHGGPHSLVLPLVRDGS
jgi:arginine deiminase